MSPLEEDLGKSDGPPVTVEDIPDSFNFDNGPVIGDIAINAEDREDQIIPAI